MSFKLDEGFCSTCGSILPIPLTNIDEFIKCRCGYRIPFQSCDGMVVSKVEVVFNEMKEKKDKKKKDNKSMSGPTIERVCSHCGHNEMTYKTQQMRSADEGMSIFYYCLKCGKLEKEDS